jgi:hypothetical protein
MITTHVGKKVKPEISLFKDEALQWWLEIALRWGWMPKP